LNNKGFTLLEVSIALFIGIAMVYTVLFVPIQIINSHTYISKEITHLQDVSLFSAQFYKDIEKEIKNASENDNVLEMNDSLSYEFTEDGIVRNKNGVSKKITNQSSTYSLDNDILTVVLTSKNSKSVELVFDLSYPLVEVEKND
jgi:prepilin-type N-terminal cleavage/methylation domain-containing protein